MRSIQNENTVYLVNQEGHIYITDRRNSYKVVKKLVGNRGSVRALACFVQGENEYVLSGGCDRHIRVFDPKCEMQRSSEIAHAYVKQKVNSILVAPLGKLKE